MAHVLRVAPSRVRGLKRLRRQKEFPPPSGRTLTGAWIETVIIKQKPLKPTVAPLRVHG